MASEAGMSKIGVVLLAAHGTSWTMDSLESILAIDSPSMSVHVVDMRLNESVVEVVTQRYPEADMIELRSNPGRASGFNAGIRRALGTSATHIMLLSSNLVVAPDSLRRMLRIAESDPTIGIVMPKIYCHERPDTIWSAGGRRRLVPPAFEFIGFGHHDAEEFDVPNEIGFAPANGVLVTRRVFETVGLFDTAYRSYYSDWDFSNRVRAHGFEIVFEPKALMWHKESTTAERQHELPWRAWGESSARYHRRYGQPAALSLPINIGYMLVREAIQGNLRALPQLLVGSLAGLRQSLDPRPSLHDGE